MTNMRTVLTVAAIGALLMAGCSEEDPAGEGADVVEDADDTADDAAEETPDESQDDDADGGDEPDKVGTRGNPAEIGTRVTVGEWEVEIVEVNTDAWEHIQAANQFNEPPSEGFTYVMWRTQAAYVGDESGNPQVDLTWRIVGSEGNSFDTMTDDGCGPPPEPFYEQGETFPGGEISGNVCIAAEEAQLDGGTIAVQSMMGQNRVFFAIP